METVRWVRGHDSRDMCTLPAHVEDGRVVRGASDPGQPCPNRDTDNCCTGIGEGTMYQSTWLDVAAHQELARGAT